jgi:guanylate kinase
MASGTAITFSPRKIIVITAPSGAGKTSVVKKLLTHMPQLSFSVSATTRSRRDNEVDGKDYYFLSVADFQDKIRAGAFVEFEEVYAGQFYGTLHAEIERIWGQRKIALFDVDVKGALAIKEKYGQDVFTVFISPPSLEVLQARLEGRKTESKESLSKRLNKSKEEMSYANRFDYQVINKDFDTAYMRVKNAVLKYLHST